MTVAVSNDTLGNAAFSRKLVILLFQCEWLRSLCDLLFKNFPGMKFEQEEREKAEDNLLSKCRF
jgi:hypothetical protein